MYFLFILVAMDIVTHILSVIGSIMGPSDFLYYRNSIKLTVRYHTIQLIVVINRTSFAKATGSPLFMLES